MHERPGTDRHDEDGSVDERAIAEHRERYRSMFTHNPDTAFSLDLDGRYQAVNPATTRITGYGEEELRGMDFGQVIHPDDLPDVLLAFQDVVARQPRSLECRVRHRDGHTIEMVLTAVPVIVDDEVVGVHGVAQDVTERNRLLRELEDARRAAEEASAAKSVFIANVSHELRTPLAGLLAALELVTETPLGGPQPKLVDIAQRSGMRLLRLVDDLLSFSRLEAGSLPLRTEPLSVRQLVTEATEVVAPAAGSRGLDLETHVDPDLDLPLLGDRLRLSQVLVNLLDNAVKFTDPGGSVQIAADRPSSSIAAGRGETAFETAGASPTMAVRFQVRDTGIGIPHHEHDRLFEPFVQADGSITRRHGGTGLGLAICRELTTLMGGTVELDSTPGQGSRFTVVVPLQRAASDQP